MNEFKERFSQHVNQLQEDFLRALVGLDPQAEIVRDCWQRKDSEGKPGGGGDTRVLQGEVIEKAGVNVSLVYGAMEQDFARELGSEQNEMWATGISVIVHPRNPRIPSFHANFRLIELGSRSWFGGGADLTPYYPHEEDFLAFHRHWSEACSPYGNYPEMKSKCDQYFVNVHRGGEMRGVGGIFFDRFRTENIHKDLKMALELSAAFPGSYLPIVSRRKDETATLEDEEFQLMRRGRYAEFNLLHDRGTAFGLRTGGRVESILVSMPPRCTFPYKYKACTGSAQEKMLKYYWPRDWDL